MNFDRIAHLVKLVFSTRIVAISLVDGTEEYVPSLLHLLWILSAEPDSSSQSVGICVCAYVCHLQKISFITAGFGVQNMPRTSSFNAHAVLQR